MSVANCCIFNKLLTKLLYFDSTATTRVPLRAQSRLWSGLPSTQSTLSSTAVGDRMTCSDLPVPWFLETGVSLFRSYKKNAKTCLIHAKNSHSTVFFLSWGHFTHSLSSSCRFHLLRFALMVQGEMCWNLHVFDIYGHWWWYKTKKWNVLLLEI